MSRWLKLPGLPFFSSAPTIKSEGSPHTSLEDVPEGRGSLLERESPNQLHDVGADSDVKMGNPDRAIGALDGLAGEKSASSEKTSAEHRLVKAKKKKKTSAGLRASEDINRTADLQSEADADDLESNGTKPKRPKAERSKKKPSAALKEERNEDSAERVASILNKGRKESNKANEASELISGNSIGEHISTQGSDAIETTVNETEDQYALNGLANLPEKIKKAKRKLEKSQRKHHRPKSQEKPDGRIADVSEEVFHKPLKHVPVIHGPGKHLVESEGPHETTAQLPSGTQSGNERNLYPTIEAVKRSGTFNRALDKRKASDEPVLPPAKKVKHGQTRLSSNDADIRNFGTMVESHQATIAMSQRAPPSSIMPPPKAQVRGHSQESKFQPRFSPILPPPENLTGPLASEYIRRSTPRWSAINSADQGLNPSSSSKLLSSSEQEYSHTTSPPEKKRRRNKTDKSSTNTLNSARAQVILPSRIERHDNHTSREDLNVGIDEPVAEPNSLFWKKRTLSPRTQNRAGDQADQETEDTSVPHPELKLGRSSRSPVFVGDGDDVDDAVGLMPSTSLPGVKRKRRLPTGESNVSEIQRAKSAKSYEKRLPKTPKSKAGSPKSKTTPATAGRLSVDDIEAIADAVESYRQMHDLEQRDLNGLIQREVCADSKQLWDHICDGVPHLARPKVFSTCRRKFHNFEARGSWTEEQDDEMRLAYELHPKKWKVIGAIINRFPEDVRDRWRNYLVCGDNMKKDLWTQEEEDRLRRIVQECLENIKSAKKQNSKNVKLNLAVSENLLDWNIVSQKMDHTRSRLQCVNKWKILKDRGMVDVEEPELPEIGTTLWRISQAEVTALLMKPKSKLKLLRAIRDTASGQESKVPWKTMISKRMRAKGKLMALKICFRALRLQVPGHQDMTFQDIVSHLINAFEQAAPHEPVNFAEIHKFFPTQLGTINQMTHTPRHKTKNFQSSTKQLSSMYVSEDDDDDLEIGEGSSLQTPGQSDPTRKSTATLVKRTDEANTSMPKKESTNITKRMKQLQQKQSQDSTISRRKGKEPLVKAQTHGIAKPNKKTKPLLVHSEKNVSHEDEIERSISRDSNSLQLSGDEDKSANSYSTSDSEEEIDADQQEFSMKISSSSPAHKTDNLEAEEEPLSSPVDTRFLYESEEENNHRNEPTSDTSSESESVEDQYGGYTLEDEDQEEEVLPTLRNRWEHREASLDLDTPQKQGLDSPFEGIYARENSTPSISSDGSDDDIPAVARPRSSLQRLLSEELT